MAANWLYRDNKELKVMIYCYYKLKIFIFIVFFLKHMVFKAGIIDNYRIVLLDHFYLFVYSIFNS